MHGAEMFMQVESPERGSEIEKADTKGIMGYGATQTALRIGYEKGI